MEGLRASAVSPLSDISCVLRFDGKTTDYFSGRPPQMVFYCDRMTGLGLKPSARAPEWPPRENGSRKNEREMPHRKWNPKTLGATKVRGGRAIKQFVEWLTLLALQTARCIVITSWGNNHLWQRQRQSNRTLHSHFHDMVAEKRKPTTISKYALCLKVCITSCDSLLWTGNVIVIGGATAAATPAVGIVIVGVFQIVAKCAYSTE